MDPLNNPTSIPTPTPTPTPAPTPGSTAAPTPAPTLTHSSTPISTASPVASSMPNMPANPTPAQASGTVPPVAAPQVNPVGTMPASRMFQPSGVGVAATEPIMMPEQPKAPDPIEEELKAPMKAAAPVPGSIGSAVSGPSSTASSDSMSEPNSVMNNQSGMPNVGNGFSTASNAGNEPAVSSAVNPFAKTNTPSVSFADPALQPNVAGSQPVKTKAVKKNSKTTLIALIVIAGMVIIALGAVFVFQLIG